jgi:hypothetical protein
VLRHVVCFRFREGTTPEDVAALSAALAALPDQIPGIRAYAFGADVGAAEGNHDYVIVGDYDDVDAWRRYLAHPAHVALVEHHIAPITENRVAVQFELPG